MAARCSCLSDITGRDISSDGLRALSLTCSSLLTVVEFKQVDASDSNIERLCKGCPGLKTLKLILKSSSSDDVTDESISSIVRYCPDIECLSLEGWKSITDASMVTLTALTCLKEMNLYSCTHLTSAGVQSLVSSIGAHLEVIILSDMYNAPREICNYCDSVLLRCIGENCSNLLRFSVTTRADPTVTEASYIALVQGCPLLQDLSVFYKNITDSFLIQLAECCPDLQNLTCRSNNYGDAGVVAVTNKCTKLKYLQLFRDGALKITDTSISSIAMNLKHLKGVHLLGTYSISDAGFCLLFESCPHLVAFSLTSSTLITDRSLLALVRYCLGLKELKLLGNSKLTEKSLVALPTLYELEVLFIVDCPSLSDDIVCLLARLCSKLKKIKIEQCPLVTRRALVELLTQCRGLTSLSMQQCCVELSASFKTTHLAKRSSSRRLKVELGALGVFAL